MPQHFHDARRRARARRGNVGEELAGVQGMRTIDVFFRRHAGRHAASVDVRRQRGLDKNAVDLRPLVQAAKDGEQIALRDAGGRSDFFAVNAQFAASFFFMADVDLGRRIVADEHHGETGRPRQAADASLERGEDPAAHQLAVEDLSGHANVRIAERCAGSAVRSLRRLDKRRASLLIAIAVWQARLGSRVIAVKAGRGGGRDIAGQIAEVLDDVRSSNI